MKKLMIMAAIVCAAVASQAASFNWKTAKSGGAVNAPDGKALAASTAYLFEATSAEAVFNAFVAGNDWTTGSLDNNGISTAGKISSKTEVISYGGTGAATLNAIFAFTEKIDGTDYLYISSVGSASGDALGTATINFAESGVSAAAKDIKAGYAGAGWYAQSVPEPTSGLLLLLGMAGMALRRRRV